MTGGRTSRIGLALVVLANAVIAIELLAVGSFGVAGVVFFLLVPYESDVLGPVMVFFALPFFGAIAALAFGAVIWLARTLRRSSTLVGRTRLAQLDVAIIVLGGLLLIRSFLDRGRFSPSELAVDILLIGAWTGWAAALIGVFAAWWLEATPSTRRRYRRVSALGIWAGIVLLVIWLRPNGVADQICTPDVGACAELALGGWWTQTLPGRLWLAFFGFGLVVVWAFDRWTSRRQV